MSIVEHLRKLASGEAQPAVRRTGLCVELHERFPDAAQLALDLAAEQYDRFEYYSGELEYPIAPPGDGCPLRAYRARPDLWGDDEYGRRRREFCGFVADVLERSGRMW